MTTLVYAIIVLGALAIIFGLILAIAAKVFEVEVDPRLPEIMGMPGRRQLRRLRLPRLRRLRRGHPGR